MKLFILVLLCSFCCCIERGLKKKENVVVNHGLELLSTLENHPSICFKQVALELYSDCPCMGFQSVRNMRYAVMLTVCELDMAGAYIPRECTLSDFENISALKTCAKKLSVKSPTWTSYSGYFRDIGIICFSIRYPIERDTIESLYKNISETQYENINLLREEQKYLINWRQEEIASIQKSIYSQKKFIDYFDCIKRIVTQTTNEISGLQDIVILLQKNAEIHIDKQNNLIRYVVDDIHDQLHSLLLQRNAAIENIFESLEGEIENIGYSLKDLIHSQSQSFDIWRDVQEIQDQFINGWEISTEEVNKSIDNILGHVLDEKKEIERGVSGLDLKIRNIFSLIGLVDLTAKNTYKELFYYALWLYIYHVFTIMRINKHYFLVLFSLSGNFKYHVDNYSNTFKIIVVMLEIAKRMYFRYNQRTVHHNSIKNQQKSLIVAQNSDHLPEDIIDTLPHQIVPNFRINAASLRESEHTFNRYYFQRYY